MWSQQPSEVVIGKPVGKRRSQLWWGGWALNEEQCVEWWALLYHRLTCALRPVRLSPFISINSLAYKPTWLCQIVSDSFFLWRFLACFYNLESCPFKKKQNIFMTSNKRAQTFLILLLNGDQRNTQWKLVKPGICSPWIVLCVRETFPE